jgi:hypothetical protein
MYQSIVEMRLDPKKRFQVRKGASLLAEALSLASASASSTLDDLG